MSGLCNEWICKVCVCVCVRVGFVMCGCVYEGIL